MNNLPEAATAYPIFTIKVYYDPETTSWWAFNDVTGITGSAWNLETLLNNEVWNFAEFHGNGGQFSEDPKENHERFKQLSGCKISKEES